MIWNKTKFFYFSLWPFWNTRFFHSIDRKLTKDYYVLAVPPPNRAYLRTLIHSGDLEHLEKVVLDGHGHKLLHETSALEKVTKFIYALPDFMVKLLVMLEYAKVEWSCCTLTVSTKLCLMNDWPFSSKLCWFSEILTPFFLNPCAVIHYTLYWCVYQNYCQNLKDIYRMHAIITLGLYVFPPFLETISLFFKDFF